MSWKVGIFEDGRVRGGEGGSVWEEVVAGARSFLDTFSGVSE